MFLIVGLGNPGKKYEKTRHNAGSIIIDELSFLNLEGVFLQKPKTFMNESGKAVKQIINKLKIPISKLIVIHDDIDLPLGAIRIAKNRGSAGHKGVESIIKELGNNDFIRFRIGIQPQKGKPKNPERFVLEKFKKEEEIILKEVIKKTMEAIETIAREGLEKAMNVYN